jgi:hypothetical protein
MCSRSASGRTIVAISPRSSCSGGASSFENAIASRPEPQSGFDSDGREKISSTGLQCRYGLAAPNHRESAAVVLDRDQQVSEPPRGLRRRNLTFF